MKKHSERAHALLSASGASRWLNCTPSAKLEEQYGVHTTSSYAKEGTLAHELAELYLRTDILKNLSDAELEIALERIMSQEEFSDEMLDVVPIYVDYCIAQYNEAKARSEISLIELEQKLDLTAYVPESFGTADCVVISDGVLEVIDLKYGKGVPVYATWNTQLMLYGLGALQKYDAMYDIHTVRLTIVQPRINNINSFEIAVNELREWAENELRQKANLAFVGAGELNAGDWCRFCAVKNRCKALYQKQVEIAKHEFKKPELLTDTEIAEIVLRVPALVEWANSVAEYARTQSLEHNKTWPGLKLVEGISRRKWADSDKVAATLFASMPSLSEDEIYDMKLKSITAIEKLLGKSKFAELLSGLVIKPQGKPTLVALDDKRPAMGLSQAQIDFQNN